MSRKKQAVRQAKDPVVAADMAQYVEDGLREILLTATQSGEYDMAIALSNVAKAAQKRKYELIEDASRHEEMIRRFAGEGI